MVSPSHRSGLLKQILFEFWYKMLSPPDRQIVKYFRMVDRSTEQLSNMSSLKSVTLQCGLTTAAKYDLKVTDELHLHHLQSQGVFFSDMLTYFVSLPVLICFAISMFFPSEPP